MIYASVWGTMLLEWKNEVVVVKLFRSSDDGALDKDSIKSTQKPYFGIEIAEISKTSNQENCCLIANTTFKKK